MILNLFIEGESMSYRLGLYFASIAFEIFVLRALVINEEFLRHAKKFAD